METSTIVIILIVGILFLFVFYGIGVYNKLVNARNKVDNQFSQINQLAQCDLPVRFHEPQLKR